MLNNWDYAAAFIASVTALYGFLMFIGVDNAKVMLFGIPAIAWCVMVVIKQWGFEDE